MAFAQAIEDGVIFHLSLTITLRIIRLRELMGDLVLGAGSSHLSASEVSSVVGYDGVSEAEVTYDVLPHEFDHLLPCDFKERHNFDPLGEIISCNQQELELRLCLGK